MYYIIYIGSEIGIATRLISLVECWKAGRRSINTDTTEAELMTTRIRLECLKLAWLWLFLH